MSFATFAKGQVAPPLESKRFSADTASQEETAFTVVELIVMVGTLCLLTLALTSTVASTRPGAATVTCMNNLRQLGNAWQMYADDYNGNLVYNRDGISNGKSAGNECWVGGWLDFSSANTDNTNTSVLVDHARYPYGAYLGPYLKSADLFRCPADGSFVTIGDQQIHRVRSYSMNNTFGLEARMWTTPSSFTFHTNLSNIKLPHQVFVLLEESYGSINDGCFFSDPDTIWQIVDFPADYHHASCNFFFADGHTELHRWKDSRTMPVIAPSGYVPGVNENLPGDVDVDWLNQHVSERR
ncbi:MAG TPA: hypothetical protein VFE51_15260 [Verrucomicrobiae bacterium]|nr:hypothetical protein [Verrucomicrobiae bacterium]